MVLGIDIRALVDVKEFEKINRELNKKLGNFNAQLGGKLKNANGEANNLGQNLSSIGNRLGFMAFQWKFMAGAANQALNSVLGNLQKIIEEGAKLSDQLSRALVFANDDLREFAKMTETGAKNVTSLRDAIFELGSGKTIFGIDQISGQARELQKAFGNLDATKNVLPFAAAIKTIEPELSDEKLGSGLVSLFNSLDVDPTNLQQVAGAMDFLAQVSNTSTANFQSSIASLGVASKQAKSIGINAFELGATITQVSDVLARNKGGGRAAATPGEYANAFFRDLKAIASASTKQGKFARETGLDIFRINPKTLKSEFKDLEGIVEAFRAQFNRRSTGERAAYIKDLGLGENSERTINALLEFSTEELRDQLKLLKERGGLKILQAGIEVSGQSQILRLKNAIDSFKISLADGFAPALKVAADLIQEIASDKGFREVIALFGRALADVAIPAIKEVVKLLKSFFNIFKKNKKLIQAAAVGIGVLVTALSGLIILATIGFYAAVTGGSLFAIGGQAITAATGLGILKLGILGVLRTILPLAIIGVGLITILGGLSGIFDEKLAPAITAVGVAIAGLGSLMLLYPNKFLAFGASMLANLVPSKIFENIRSIGPALDATFRTFKTEGVIGSFKLLGTGIKDAIVGPAGAGGTPGALTKLMGLLTAHPLAAGIVAAIAIGASFAYWLDTTVKDSPFFKGGLTTYWETAGFELKAAVGKTLRGMGDAFTAFAKFADETWRGVVSSVIDIWDKLSKGDWEGLRQALATALNPVNLPSFFADALNADKQALDEIRVIFSKLKKDFASGKLNPLYDSPEEIESIFERIKDVTGSKISVNKLKEAANVAFGENVFPKEILPPQFSGQSFEQITQAESQFGEFDFAITGFKQSVTDHTAALDKVKNQLYEEADLKALQLEAIKAEEEFATYNQEVQDEINRLKVAAGEMISGESKSIATSTKVTNQNALLTDENTVNTVADSKTIIKGIDTQKLGILELVKNINMISEMTTMMARVNLMWAKLIAEGNRAGGKLASLSVSSSGKFSIKDPGLTEGDKKLISNASSALSSTMANQLRISLSQTEAELKTIETVLTEAKNIAQTTQTSTSQIADHTVGFKDLNAKSINLPTVGEVTRSLSDINKIISDYKSGTGLSGLRATEYELKKQELLNSFNSLGQFGTLNTDSSVFGGRNPTLLGNGAGNFAVDINVDGAFDINVQNGALTESQLVEITNRFGKKIAEELSKAIGVQKLA